MYKLLISFIILLILCWYNERLNEMFTGNKVLHILHIGKTGGRALKSSLNGHHNIKVMKHSINAEDLNKCSNCKISAVIRDPKDRLLSAIYWFKQGGEFNREQLNNPCHKFVKNKSINKILSNPSLFNRKCAVHNNAAFKPSINYMKNNEGIVTPLCYNKLDKEFENKIKPFCNDNNCTLTTKNKSKRLKYNELDKKDKNAIDNYVTKFYIEDLEYYKKNCNK
jgi:hypothetical protein